MSLPMRRLTLGLAAPIVALAAIASAQDRDGNQVELLMPQRQCPDRVIRGIPDRVIRGITAGRGIPAGGVATRSNMPNILARRASPSRRRAPAFTPRITRPGH